MVGMAEKPAKKAGRPKKHPGTEDSQGRTGKTLSLRLDPELRALVPQFIAAFKKRHDVKLDITSTVELALTRLFREWDLLPPEDAGSVGPGTRSSSQS
jgi:hypothetical protein